MGCAPYYATVLALPHVMPAAQPLLLEPPIATLEHLPGGAEADSAD